MRVTVESTQLKTLLTEEEYHSGFSKIQGGDMFIVVTDNKTYNGKVVDKYSTQIIVQIEGRNYVVTSNSLHDDELRSNEMVNGQKQPTSITKNVKTIIIRRNGNTITTLIPTNGRSNGNNGASGKPNKGPKPKAPFIKPFYKNAFHEVVSVLKTVKQDNKLIIKCGELITPDEIGTDSIITIEIHVRKIFKDDIILGAVTNIKGDTAGKYGDLQKDFIKISISESVELTENGVTLLIKTKKGGNSILLEGVFEIHIGEFFNIKEPTFDDLMKDKGFRDIMLKEPNLMGQISGQMGKGVLPASELLKKLGLNKGYFTRGKKVKFTYTGQEIRPKQVLTLSSGKEYIGVFNSSKEIKLSGSRRGESLLLKMKKKVKEQIYEVEITFNKLSNGQQEKHVVGHGIIQITDINFK